LTRPYSIVGSLLFAIVCAVVGAVLPKHATPLPESKLLFAILIPALFSGYVATPLTQFATGALLVVSLPFVRAILARITRPMAAGMSVNHADLMHLLTGLCALVVAAVLAVELEALFVRFLNRVPVGSGEP